MAAPSPKQRAVALKRGGMDDGMVGAVLGISADDVRSLLYDADPDVELPADLALATSTVVLSDAQIKALPTTKVEVVPSAGPGKAIDLIRVALAARIIEIADRYTNLHANSEVRFYTGEDGVSEIGMKISNPLAGIVEDLLASSSNVGIGGNTVFLPGTADVNDYGDANFSAQPVQENRGDDVDDRAIYLGLSNSANGNLTGGNPDNTLIVQAAYMLVDLA